MQYFSDIFMIYEKRAVYRNESNFLWKQKWLKFLWFISSAKTIEKNLLISEGTCWKNVSTSWNIYSLFMEWFSVYNNRKSHLKKEKLQLICSNRGLLLSQQIFFSFITIGQIFNQNNNRYFSRIDIGAFNFVSVWQDSG